ncbi:uncharacterized protein LOC135691688 [Rhopilema esculentum]|uniref:uncharacterized protein LOC135691688 n=1 Tax=Rhopilema esculentum TaxID=499914 RepID=UPI0031DFC7E7|eukprot:gene8921-16547_t
MESVWESKFTALKKQCIDVEKNNLKLMNRIYHIKKMTKRAQKERRAIMDRLDMHNDNFRYFDLYFEADVLKENAAVKPQKRYARMYESSRGSSAKRLGQDMASEFKDVEMTQEERVAPRRGLVLSPNLTSFTDNSDLQSNISLPQIPSPTLADVDHPFGMATIPSPSFR